MKLISHYILVILIVPSLCSLTYLLSVFKPLKDSYDNLKDSVGGFVNALKSAQNPICGFHIIRDSLRYLSLGHPAPNRDFNRQYLSSYDNDTDEDKMVKMYGEYAALSYCSLDELHVLSRLNLRVGMFDVLDYALDMNGRLILLILFNRERKEIVVSFRGTANEDDFNIDIMTGGVDPSFQITKESVSASIHEGFWTRFSDYREVVGRKLQPIYTKGEIIIVGHSLGACWAYFQASDLIINWGIPVSKVFIYGAPKCAERKFQDAIATTIGVENIYRVTNANDLAPKIGYAYGSHPTMVDEYYFDKESNTGRRCNKGDDETCNAQWSCNDSSWEAHSYLGNLTIAKNYCSLNRKVSDSIYHMNISDVLTEPPEPPLYLPPKINTDKSISNKH